MAGEYTILIIVRPSSAIFSFKSGPAVTKPPTASIYNAFKGKGQRSPDISN
jgi:hypothetical protein